jgi:hypothetical protein
MVERSAVLDVHRDDVVATMPVPGPDRRRFDQETQTFKATLARLAQLALWLAEAVVEVAPFRRGTSVTAIPGVIVTQ